MDDRSFLGLRATPDPTRWQLPVVRGITVPERFLFGGCGLAAAVSAARRRRRSERSTIRPRDDFANEPSPLNAVMGGGATTVLIQSQCLLRVVGHVGLIDDGTAFSGVEDALAGRPVTLRCFAL